MAGIAGLLRAVFVGRDDGWRAKARRAGSALRRPPTPTPAGAAPAEPGVPSGLVGFEDVLPSSAIAEGEVVEAFVGGASVAVCRVAGAVHAVSGVCPHAAGPLADGALHGRLLTCPQHGWQFDVVDGRCVVDADKPVPTVKVIEVNGRVWVHAGANPSRTDAPSS